MPRPDSVAIVEAERQMVICNACRYCEGFCAVFPALELRTSFQPADLVYLSNLCHDCRACFYACQYAPPHAFSVNIPRALTDVRNESYADYSWPPILARLRSSAAAAVLLVVACLVAISGFVVLSRGANVLSSPQAGEGAFYRVIPYVAMVAPALVICAYAGLILALGAGRFWQDTGSALAGRLNMAAVTIATRDALALRYMRGGGDGCNYPTEQFSNTRRWFHHLTYYGFGLDLASTIVAAIYDHGFGWIAPYPVWSVPVVLGSAGGVMLLVGTGGLLWLKTQSDPGPGTSQMRRMDVIFLALLMATAMTGMLLLVVRDTVAMPALLVVHLAVVAGLFLSLPYGKFVHAVFRSAALLRNATERPQA